LQRLFSVTVGADQSLLLLHQGQGPTVRALLRDAAVSRLGRAGRCAADYGPLALPQSASHGRSRLTPGAAPADA